MKFMLKRILLGLAVIFYVLAGLNHFWNPEFYLNVIARWLPAPQLMNIISGLAEVFLGLMLIYKPWRQMASYGLILLLLAIYPANVYMAMHPELFPQIKPLWLYLRLPFQFVFIAWAWWIGRDSSASGQRKTAL